MMELRVPCAPDAPVSRDEHKHLCDCGTCWKHRDAVQDMGTKAFNEAHSCPSCGTRVTMKHFDYDDIANLFQRVR